jgi:uncharacterized protein YdcH (DUF465 family)
LKYTAAIFRAPELTTKIMESGNILNSNQARVDTLTSKILELKDRIALEKDSNVKGKMVSVLLELEEFRKLVQSLQENSSSFKSENDVNLTEMEQNIISGRGFFRGTFKNAGPIRNQA